MTFDIDANGIVHVSAKDKATNIDHSITIQSSGGLNENEINEMISKAEKYKNEDKERRVIYHHLMFKELVDLKNEADSIIFSTDKNLNQYRQKLQQNEIDVILVFIINHRRSNLLFRI